MSQLKKIENVAIVGAGGRIGGSFAEELLRTGKHTVTALTRNGSKSALPEGVKVVEVDYEDEAGLVAALQAQDFLIITLSVRAPGKVNRNLVKAAGQAGVRYVMPNIYGGDILDKAHVEQGVTANIFKERMAEFEGVNTSYIVLVCGQWYEWSLALGEQWFGFTMKERKVTFYDDGKTRINVSTWDQCGRAIAALLSLPESGASPCVADFKNKPLYVSSFRVSQRDMLDSIHRVSGTTDQDWEISHEPSEKRFNDGLAELKQGIRTGYAKALYAHAFFPNGKGDYESKRGLNNDTLGLPKESLDEATKRTLNMVENGFIEATFNELSS